MVFLHSKVWESMLLPSWQTLTEVGIGGSVCRYVSEESV